MTGTIAELRRLGDIAAINRIIPYAAVVGLESFDDEGGFVTVLRHRASNIGNTTIPALHGGVVGALMEHAAILHLLRETDCETIAKTINITIDYLRPCLAADTFARGLVVRHGRRIANVRVEAWQSDPKKPVAAAHCHFLLG